MHSEQTKNETVIKVTFDSNTFRKVINPAVIKAPSKKEIYQKLLSLIKSGKIAPYFSSAMFVLEEAPRKSRAESFSKRRVKMTVVNEEQKNDSIRSTIEIGPNNSTAHTLSSYSLERLEKCLSLGFKMIHFPRLGLAIPHEIASIIKFTSDYENFHAKLALKGKINKEFLDKKIGAYQWFLIRDRLSIRNNGEPPNLSNLVNSEILSLEEQKSVGSIVAEWADGDLVAAHIGEGLDIICTEDMAGGSKTKSVFSSDNRNWLTQKYDCQFMTPEMLADSF